jgi:hypothetical protein
MDVMRKPFKRALPLNSPQPDRSSERLFRNNLPRPTLCWNPALIRGASKPSQQGCTSLGRSFRLECDHAMPIFTGEVTVVCRDLKPADVKVTFSNDFFSSGGGNVASLESETKGVDCAVGPWCEIPAGVRQARTDIPVGRGMAALSARIA